MYETISEGTPISPVFDSLKVLENWLVKDQGYSRKAAQEFCVESWSPSFYGSEKFVNESKGPKR